MEGTMIERLTIEDAAYDGRGIGRHEGVVVFVPLAVPGDVICCRVVKAEKRMLLGEILSIVTPSPLRVEPACPYFAHCGGCTYQSIRYEEECRLKQNRVTSALCRIGGVREERILPILGADVPERYRNNVQLAVALGKDGAPAMGYRVRGSHHVVDVTDCLLLPGNMMAAAEALRGYLMAHGEAAWQKGKRIRHLCLRCAGKEVMATVVSEGKTLIEEGDLAARFRRAGVDTLCHHKNDRPRGGVFQNSRVRVLYGKGYLIDTLCGMEFRLSPTSFFQVNHAQAERLYETARAYADLRPGETLMDLYCGTGTIGLILCGGTGTLIGVERMESAVEDAVENARRLGMPSARFLLSDAAGAAKTLEEEGIRPDVVVVDPPRQGCDDEALSAIARMAPGRVVYISCDPGTLARDVKRMAALGYTLVKAQPIDLFPRTPHVETVCLLSRK